MFLRARWDGSPPQIGEYLMAQQRPRFAYRITDVEVRRIDKGTDRTFLGLHVERIDAKDVPPGAVRHPWKWDPHRKLGHAWSAA